MLNIQILQIIKGASQSECIVQSINCSASDGTNCQDKQKLQSCQSYLKQKQCQYVLGSNGFCFWQSNSCQVLSKCTSIQTQLDCQYFKKQCYWVYDSSCQPASCSQFQTVETCQFYYTSINSYTTVPCQWNSTTGVCLQPTNYMTQLNSNNCQHQQRCSMELYFEFLIELSNFQTPKTVQLFQLVTQLNSMQSLQCLWNNQTNSCQQLPCANLQQSLYIQNSQCIFEATSSDECAAQSLYCPYYNSTQKQCQATSISDFKIAMGYLYKIVTFLYHHITIAVGIMNQTNVRFKGKLIIVKIIVNTIAKAFPIAIIKMDVKKKQCQHYQTKQSCTFSFKPQNWNYIQQCSWLKGAYVPANNLFSEQTCFTNTDQTARWSSNIKDGVCIPCNLPLYQVIIPKNQCLCSQLLTYQECDQASCYWEGSVCTDLNCERLNNQIDCILNYQCFWIYQTNTPQGGYCENLDYKELLYSKDPCTKLLGNNSLECLSQSLLCPVSLNGVCQNRALLQTCQSMNSLQLCANSIGQEGYCTYENQQCQVLTSCSRLKNICSSIQLQICQFVAISGKCEQLYCSSFQTEKLVHIKNLDVCLEWFVKYLFFSFISDLLNILKLVFKYWRHLSLEYLSNNKQLLCFMFIKYDKAKEYLFMY